ncbi:MAG: dimethyl sulfoxide reductase anchor subunit family protein [Betaproteobacteria bacterium]|jgi:DMSO reductase anchor subunit|nr:dimethyl sulfoxide reductase anchor subunit [Betaproteobacteria bacterium]
MNPAFSVVFLTTLIGAGQGLFLAMVGVEAAAAAHWLDAPGTAFYVTGSVLSVLLLGCGLLASFFHLGHPERAWRAIAMWRTSWLSREVIVLPAFIAAVALYGLLHLLDHDATLAVAGPGVLLCLLLFWCTGMIYACIKFLQEWATPLTLVNFTLLGSASGLMLAAALSALRGDGHAEVLAGWALGLTFAGFFTRVAALLRNDRLRPKSTLQSAIGVNHPRVVQKSQGFTGGSFNTREFFHGRGPGTLRAVKWLFLVAGFILPALLAASYLDGGSNWKPVAATLIQFAGLVAERWFFFAQANHPQNLYYQAVS